MALLITYLLIAILVSFICSILEAVLLSSTDAYIESLNDKKKSKSVKLLKDLKEDIDKPISSILILNTFAHTMGAAGVGAQVQILFGQEWQTLWAFILTLAILYFSEIIPKTIGAIYWKKLLIPSAYVISLLIKISYPLVWVSTFITKFLSKNKKDEKSVSREEIMAIVSLGEKEGCILSKESTLISNLFKLNNVLAKDVMTPRSVVFFLDESIKVSEAIEDERIYVYSRIPIFKENIDEITGVVLNQIVLEENIENKGDTLLKQLSNDVHKVSEETPVSHLLDSFIKKKSHLFIVYDEYGQTSGIVTLEDVLEALLGVEIMDEMDEVEDMQVFAKNRNKLHKNQLILKQQRENLK